MDDNDCVGYKRPPKETRFKKGRSGNPKGRPKRNVLENLTRMMNNKVHVSVNGEKRQATQIEVFMMNLFKRACEGNPSSQKIFFDFMKIYILPDAVKQLEQKVKNEIKEDGDFTDPIQAAKAYKQVIKSL